MAFSLTQLRAQRKTSIYGRRLGLDTNDFLVGPRGLREEIEDIATSPTTASNNGIARIISSAGTSNSIPQTLAAPVPGCRKIIYHYGASTSAHVFGMGGSAIVQGGSLTSAGSTMISFFRQNAMVELLGISTAIWLMLNSKSSANASSDMWGISFSATVSS